MRTYSIPCRGRVVWPCCPVPPHPAVSHVLESSLFGWGDDLESASSVLAQGLEDLIVSVLQASRLPAFLPLMSGDRPAGGRTPFCPVLHWDRGRTACCLRTAHNP